MYAGSTKANTGRYSTRVRLTNEELSFVDKFSYLGHVMTADCRDDQDIKNRFRKQNAVGNMLVRKVSFAPMETKFQLFKLYCCPVYGQVLQYNLFHYFIRKLTVSYSDTFKRFINVHKLESGICVEHKWQYQCGLLQICLWVDEQSNNFLPSPTVLLLPLSIVMHILSLLIYKWESILCV